MALSGLCRSQLNTFFNRRKNRKRKINREDREGSEEKNFNAKTQRKYKGAKENANQKQRASPYNNLFKGVALVFNFSFLFSLRLCIFFASLR